MAGASATRTAPAEAFRSDTFKMDDTAPRGPMQKMMGRHGSVDQEPIVMVTQWIAPAHWMMAVESMGTIVRPGYAALNTESAWLS